MSNMDNQDKNDIEKEIEELKKQLEDNLNGNNFNFKMDTNHNISKFLFGLFMTFVISFICFISVIGYFSSFVSYKKWIHIIYYALSLSGIYMILSLIKPFYMKYFMLQQHLMFIVNPVITIIILLIFNYIGQDYIVFKSAISLILFYIFSDVLIGILKMFLFRFLFFGRRR